MCRQEEIELDNYKHDSKTKKKVTKAIQICHIFCKTLVIRGQFCCEKIERQKKKKTNPFTK